MHGNLTAAHACRGVFVCSPQRLSIVRTHTNGVPLRTRELGSVRRRGSPSNINICTATFLHGTDRTHSVQGAEEERQFIMTHTVEIGGGTLLSGAL